MKLRARRVHLFASSFGLFERKRPIIVNVTSFAWRACIIRNRFTSDYHRLCDSSSIPVDATGSTGDVDEAAYMR